MKLQIKSVTYFTLGLLFFGCDDLIERSIKNDPIIIITPTDGTVSQDYTQTFFWEEVNGATHYNLQIVYNKFDSSAQFRLDSLMTENKFTTTLKPSHYRWRVEAQNASSRTGIRTIQNLRIDSTSIEGQDILLLSPSDNYVSSDPQTIFTWDPLFGATEYRFELLENASTVLLDTIVRRETTLAYTLDGDGDYSWRVTAKNGNLFSNPSETRSVIIDTSSPEPAVLLTPAENSNVTSPITLTWSTTATDVMYYEVYLYKTNATTPFSTKYNPYSTKNDSSPKKKSLTFSEGVSGNKIFWKVIVVDRAGNKSSAEGTKNFTIQ
jgi:hypothetical protein